MKSGGNGWLVQPLHERKLRTERCIYMLSRVKRLFVIKTRWEAYLIIYALALGAMTRGAHYTEIYPGWPGYVLMAATAGAVFIGGAKILDAIRYEHEARQAKVTPAAEAPVEPEVDVPAHALDESDAYLLARQTSRTVHVGGSDQIH